jgi:hypothetical protein
MTPVNPIQPHYRCSEDELYEVTKIIIENLKDPVTLAKFQAKKPMKYTNVFITGLETLRTTAMALPDEESRNGVHQTAKNLLPGLVEPCKDNFMDLKGYIRDGWPDEEPKPRYEAAGLIKYNNINGDNWEAVSGLNEKMIQFIGDNGAELGNPGGMPAPFALKVSTDSTAFDTQYQLFMVSKETTIARNAKVTANNNLYDAIMDVCKDGVEMIFRTDDGGKKLFTFAVVLRSVSPPGAASLKVMSKHNDDTLVMNGNVTIKLAGQPARVVPITNGVAFFANTGHGKFDVTVTETGNPNSAVTTKEVETGVNARMTVVVG